MLVTHKPSSVQDIMCRDRGSSSPILCILLLLVTNVLASEAAAVSYDACGEDAAGDVCRGAWSVIGGDSLCSEHVDRPSIDIIRAETAEAGSEIAFELVLAGEPSESGDHLYGFQGTVGEGILGMPRRVTVWVLAGTAYLMTDLTRQLFPAKIPNAVAIAGTQLTIRIPKTDVGSCDLWNFNAFALEAEFELSPGILAAHGYYDVVDLWKCPIAEAPNWSLFLGLSISLVGTLHTRRAAR